MTTRHLCLRRLLAGLGLLSCVLANASRSDASCNQIPGVANTFRGAHGTISRPFAGPEDPVDLRLSPTCDANSRFDDPRGLAISVIFTPPAGPRQVVVMAPQCDEITKDLAACRTQPGVGAASCVPADRALLLDPVSLRFAFPDTDSLLDASDDDRTLSGPATIAVTPIGVPLPCDLVSTPCTQHPETLACIDTLYAVDGTCGPSPDPLFPHFTALPQPNDYSALCSDPVPPCTASATELRFTIDSDGNVLMPMNWSGILLANQGLSVARLLRGSSAFPAFPGRTEPIRIPGLDFLESFSPEGSTLPPIFEPQHDPSATNEVTLFGSADATYTVLRVARRSPGRTACAGGHNDGRPCGGAADCPGGTCGAAACAGGANAGKVCHADSDCLSALPNLVGRSDQRERAIEETPTAGQCGPSLFDFRSRFAGGVGPVLIPRFDAGVCQDSGVPCTSDATCGSSRCVGYRIAAKDPVPLDGLIESPDLFVTVVPEAIEGRDLNGDGDATDEVLLLANRRTGVRQPIGVAPAAGRAATRVHSESFSSPAVAVENDIVAFLEGEPLQGNIDVNGDGDVFDTPLRILRSTDAGVTDLLPAPPVMANAAPVINGASVVVSDGLVFVRVSEMDAAHRTIVRASATTTGGFANGASGRPSLSKDARQVAFESTATNLTAAPLSPSSLPPSPYKGEGRSEVRQWSAASSSSAAASEPSRLTTYVVDLRGGGPQAVRLDSPLLPPDAAAVQPWLSGDGRYVAVAARDIGGIAQIFVYDRDADGNGIFDEPGGTATMLTSRGDRVQPQPGDGDSLFPFISSSGQFVGFVSSSTTIVPSVTNSNKPVNLRAFAVDRDLRRSGVFDDWELDVNHDGHSDGVLPWLLSGFGTVSPTTLQPPSMSADGSVAAFATFDHDIGRPDDNDFCLNVGNSSPTCADVVVYGPSVVGERATASSGWLGTQANNQSLSPMVSSDGGSVVYASPATNLVPGDTNGAFDVFVHDVRRVHNIGHGTTTRISVASDGTQANGPSFDRILGISDEGRYVAFASSASNLVPGDTNNVCDNDLDGRTLENCTDIFIHDRITGFTERASTTAAGADGNGASRHASLSGDGRTVAFESTASNLVPGGRNDACNSDGSYDATCTDVFVAGPDRSDPAADFNGDGDADDTLLEVFDTRQPGAGMSILAPASQVAVVGERAAFLSPETDSGIDLNGDGDTNDAVVQLYTGRNGSVINLRRAARAVALSERWVAALVSEEDEGNADLDGDGHVLGTVVQVRPADSSGAWTNLRRRGTHLDVTADIVAFDPDERDIDYNGDGTVQGVGVRVLHLYDAGNDTLINIGQAVEEFVLGPDLVAFRTSEAAQHQDLNGDGDTDDVVLQVYDVRTRRLINTGQTAIPCVYEACDPRVPYRVTAGNVKFLTLESEQGEDLNGDGDMDDLVLQTFNVPLALAAMDVQPMAGTRFQRSERRSADGGMRAAVLTTICAVSVGICSDTGSACASAADCGANAHCYLPPGGCVTNLHTACDTTLAADPCGEHQYCVPTKLQGRGECYLAEGSCRSDADCTAPAHCQDAGQNIQRLISPLLAPRSGGVVFTAAGTSGEFVVAAAGDADGDGIADPFDNCPHVANPDQADANANGIGDACEAGVATPSPTVAATSTPAPSHNDEGCAVGPRENGSVASVVLLGAWLLWALRRGKRLTNLNLPVNQLRPATTTCVNPPLTVARCPLLQRGRRVVFTPFAKGGRRAAAGGFASPVHGRSNPAAWPVSLSGRTVSRLRRAGLFFSVALAFLVGLRVPATALAPAATCAGDCDGSGSVTVDELVTLVNIAIGAEPIAACTAGDLDGNGFTIDEIVVAVGHAMNGCPVTAEQLAGGVATLVHGLSYLPLFEPVLSAYFSAAGGRGDCPSGGTLTSTCEDFGGETIRIPIVAAQCIIPTFEGTATIDGTTPLVGTGLCPSVLVPGGWQMAAHGSALFVNLAGTVLGTIQPDLRAAIQSLAFGAAPCRLRGGRAVLDGTFTYALADGTQVTLTAEALETDFHLSDLSLVYTCQPATITLTMDGAVQVVDTHAAPPVSLHATLDGLTIAIHRLTGQVEIEGVLEATWLAGRATLVTVTSLQRPLERPCFTAGTLSVDVSGAHTLVHFGSNGSVSIGRGGNGGSDAMFSSCLSPDLRTL